MCLLSTRYWWRCNHTLLAETEFGFTCVFHSPVFILSFIVDNWELAVTLFLNETICIFMFWAARDCFGSWTLLMTHAVWAARTPGPSGKWARLGVRQCPARLVAVQRVVFCISRMFPRLSSSLGCVPNEAFLYFLWICCYCQTWCGTVDPNVQRFRCLWNWNVLNVAWNVIKIDFFSSFQHLRIEGSWANKCNI